MPLSTAARWFWGLAGLTLVFLILRGFRILNLPGALGLGLVLATFFLGLWALQVSIRRRF